MRLLADGVPKATQNSLTLAQWSNTFLRASFRRRNRAFLHQDATHSPLEVGSVVQRAEVRRNERPEVPHFQHGSAVPSSLSTTTRSPERQRMVTLRFTVTGAPVNSGMRTSLKR